MKPDFASFALFDTDILSQLSGRPAVSLFGRLLPVKTTGRFEALREPELIDALYHLNYPGSYSRLKKLTHLLSPQDAMAACLCALSGTERLLETVLDHCPPIREFQFQGVGKVTSLLAAAAAYDKDTALEVLLRRGADPGPGPDGQDSPLEAAFTNQSLLALETLLNVPGLEVSLTPPMLEVWGGLRENSPNPLLEWCCQRLASKLMGMSAIPFFEPVPIPPQLRLRHALDCGNGALAARICRERPLSDGEMDDARSFLAACGQSPLLTGRDSPWEQEELQGRLSFLLSFLETHPETLEEPVLRTSVAVTALALPEPDPALTRWVERLADGPVVLPQLPYVNMPPSEPVIFPFQAMNIPVTLDSNFFPRWDQRLGSRLIPALDRGAQSPLASLPQEDLRLVLDRVAFTGAVDPDRISPAAAAVLLVGPEDQMPRLLRPGGLLAEESPQQLLDACQQLLASKRNAILPYIRKEAQYAL